VFFCGKRSRVPAPPPPPKKKTCNVQYMVLAESKPATNPADAHSLKKFGLQQPRPSPDPPSSVTGSSTAATTPRPPARAWHSLDDLYGQDSVRSSDGFDGMYNEGDSDGLDSY
jgi:hypothetical protein